MMFLNVRRSLAAIKYTFVFGLFWISVIFYVSTFKSDLFNKLKSQGLGSQNLMLKDISTTYQSNFMKEKELKIQTYRKLFNLTDPGAMGAPVVLPEVLPDAVKKLIENGWRDYTINEFVSELVPLRRSLPDIRSEYCMRQVYENLPKASVIIIFHNEAWSMILRTMHSVLDRSPEDLLVEIILVDDCSDRGISVYFNLFHISLTLRFLRAFAKALGRLHCAIPQSKAFKIAKTQWSHVESDVGRKQRKRSSLGLHRLPHGGHAGILGASFRSNWEE